MILTLLLLVTSFSPAAEQPVKNYALVDQNGKPFQLYDLKGSHLLVSFIFTRCPLPKMCPLTITLNQQVYRLWKEGKNLPPLRFLLVTLDPQNDSPNVLKKFAAARNLSDKVFTLATGNPRVLSDLASEFNVMGIPSEGMISHNVKTILLAPDLSQVEQFRDNEWKPQSVISILRKAKAPKG